MFDINDWIESYQHLPPVGVNNPASAKGVCKKVLGGRALYAEIEIYISKADHLKFTHGLANSEYELAKSENWIDGVCFGVLDVMIVRPLIPISIFECSINLIKYHNIDSSVQAFRLAGREAAEQFLKQEKFVTL